ncbi:MAG: FHA domain-containing protein [Woeseia sp.]
MELAAAGLSEQPFRTHGRPLVFVPYAAQRAAFEFLSETYEHHHGLGLFQGPALSGKTTIIRYFTETLTEDRASAIVDGAGLNTTTLLGAILSQFGYDLKFNTVNELINMVKVFSLQQTASDHAPLLIIENAHALNPSALRVLCELSELKLKGISALRLILCSDRFISSIVAAPAMTPIANRLTGEFSLGPLNLGETTDYVYAELRAGGRIDPENLIPEPVCDELHVASGGWPGIIDRLVLMALSKADACPVRKHHIERPVLPDNEAKGLAVLRKIESELKPDDRGSAPPKVILTHHGQTLREMTMEGARLLIGRSQHNDLCINSKFISRHHALFVRHGSATFVMDLNSTNGTFVNSRRISNQVVINQDIISIGNHGIKFVDPSATDRTALEGIGFSDTVIMKSLQDMRRVLARENTQVLPAQSGDASSAGDAGA